MREPEQVKAAIRAEIRAARRRMSEDEVRERSRAVIARLSGMEEFRAASAVACYIAMPGEVRTESLIAICRAAGKRVAAPAFREDAGGYELAWLDPGARVVPGPGKAPEPAAPQWLGAIAPDIVVTPLLAFDPAGNRLGHGGGHYDRLFSETPAGRAFRVGLAFDFQMRPELPARPHDVMLNAVVTESALRRMAPAARSGGRNETG